MTVDVIVEAEHVSKRFCKSLRRSLWYGVTDIAGELVPFGRSDRPSLRPGEFWALDDVSFELRRGEALGVIGANGAGKSTLLKLLNGLLKPDAGRITVRGRAGALIELGAGFNPVLTGRENVYINAAVLGLARRQVDGIFDQIIDFAEIGDFIDAPVQNYSSGMWVRLAFAVAAHLNPQVLLVDEVLAVGDMAFRRKCIQHIQRFLHGGGSLVLVSHDMFLVQSVCGRGLLLNHGQISYQGTSVETVARYLESQRDAPTSESTDHRSTNLREQTPIAIEKMEITQTSGEEVRTGDDLAITLHYQSKIDIPRVFWGFTISTADQSICIASAISGLTHGNYAVQVGQGQFRCRLPRLPLNAGTYTLRAAILDVETRAFLAQFGWEEAPAFLTVKSPISEVNNLHTMSNDLVKIDVLWESDQAT